MLLLLVVIPIIIAVISIVSVYQFGLFAVLAASLVISLYYSFGLNWIRTWSPNGHSRRISSKKNVRNLVRSLILSVVLLGVFHYAINWLG